MSADVLALLRRFINGIPERPYRLQLTLCAGKPPVIECTFSPEEVEDSTNAPVTRFELVESKAVVPVRRLSDRITIDDDQDVLTFDGVRISADVFEDRFLRPTEPGLCFRIVGRERGTVVIETRRDGGRP